MKYTLRSSLIISTGYGSRPKIHVPKVLDHHVCSYAVQSQKSDGAFRISNKIIIAY